MLNALTSIASGVQSTAKHRNAAFTVSRVRRTDDDNKLSNTSTNTFIALVLSSVEGGGGKAARGAFFFEGVFPFAAASDTQEVNVQTRKGKSLTISSYK